MTNTLTGNNIRKSMNALPFDEVLDFCWTQHETSLKARGHISDGLTKPMMASLGKDTLIECFIKTAKQLGVITR